MVKRTLVHWVGLYLRVGLNSRRYGNVAQTAYQIKDQDCVNILTGSYFENLFNKAAKFDVKNQGGGKKDPPGTDRVNLFLGMRSQGSWQPKAVHEQNFAK